MKKKRGVLLLILSAAALSFTGCAVHERPVSSASSGTPTVVATSMSVVEICEKLEIPLAGVPASSIGTIPECYADAAEVGSPMSPDMEILDSLKPDWVLSPSSLIGDLEPKYQVAGYQYAFLNLKSIPGMYRSIEELGELFDRQEQARAMVEEFETFCSDYQEKHEGEEGPSVLLLMGVPGSYIVATENSYAGSLVELAGGRNVYAGTDEEFLSVNTEDMLQKEPDIILRTAHAMPEQVMEMFAEEFRTNDIWQHFTAVKEDRVYDLTTAYFGMSADFEYPEALKELENIFYGET